jgi:hypothetical protein
MSPQAHYLVVYASLNQVHRVKRRLYQGGVYVDMVRRASLETAIEIRGVFSESLAGYCPLP